MSVLLIRLVGPMQSWGNRSRFTERDTGLEPSKSGVIGLVCAAIGRPRNESVDDLAALKMVVRVDNEGTIKKDYHTAENILRASGNGIKECEPSNRYYLTDADFLVALAGDGTLLEKVDTALKNPKWQIFLGRKSFVPSVPVWVNDGFFSDAKDNFEVLKAQPWPRKDVISEDGSIKSRAYCKMYDENTGKLKEPLRFVVETPFGVGEQVVCDQPIGAAFKTREFTIRHITTRFEPVYVRKELIEKCTCQN